MDISEAYDRHWWSLCHRDDCHLSYTHNITCPQPGICSTAAAHATDHILTPQLVYVSVEKTVATSPLDADLS